MFLLSFDPFLFALIAQLLYILIIGGQDIFLINSNELFIWKTYDLFSCYSTRNILPAYFPFRV